MKKITTITWNTRDNRTPEMFALMCSFIIKSNIQPKKLKNEVIENWEKYFIEIIESKEQTEIGVKNIYDILSRSIHVNCVRIIVSMIEKDEEKIEIIKYLKTENNLIYLVF